MWMLFQCVHSVVGLLAGTRVNWPVAMISFGNCRQSSDHRRKSSRTQRQWSVRFRLLHFFHNSRASSETACNSPCTPASSIFTVVESSGSWARGHDKSTGQKFWHIKMNFGSWREITFHEEARNPRIRLSVLIACKKYGRCHRKYSHIRVCTVKRPPRAWLNLNKGRWRNVRGFTAWAHTVTFTIFLGEDMETKEWRQWWNMLGPEGVGEIRKTSFTDRTHSLTVGHLHALLFMVHGGGIVE